MHGIGYPLSMFYWNLNTVFDVLKIFQGYYCKERSI